MATSKRILAVLSDLALYRKLEELLKRSSFEVSRVPSGAGALVLIGNMEYELVLIGAPLPDLGLDEFQRALRGLDSHGRGSPLVVLVPDADAATVAKAMGDERIGVLPMSASDAQLQAAVSEVLGVAARTSRRILVEVAAELGAGSRQRVLQTGNISRTGMLVLGSEGPHVGEVVAIRFALPEDPEPLEVDAEVMRHTDPDVEGLEGFAVRFREIRPEDRQRLDDFVRTDLGSAGGGAVGSEAVF